LTICRHLVDWRIRADCSGWITRNPERALAASPLFDLWTDL
jgi:hypothetical protein